MEKVFQLAYEHWFLSTLWLTIISYTLATVTTKWLAIRAIERIGVDDE